MTSKFIRTAIVWFVITMMITAGFDATNTSNDAKLMIEAVLLLLTVVALVRLRDSRAIPILTGAIIGLLYAAFWSLSGNVAQTDQVTQAIIKVVAVVTALLTYYWIGFKPAGSPIRPAPNVISDYEVQSLVYGFLGMFIVLSAGFAVMANQGWLALAAVMTGFAFLIKSSSIL